MDDVILIKALSLKPCNCCLAFLGHIRDDGSYIEALIGIDRAVEKDDLNAICLCVLENCIPSSRACCGNEKVINAFLDEELCCRDLLIIPEAVIERCVITILLIEYSLQICIICCAVSRFVRVIIDDTNSDETTIRS